MIYQKINLFPACLLLAAITLASCMNNDQTDNEPVAGQTQNEFAANDKNQPGETKSFQERLDANPQIQDIADEYAFTPPVPLATGEQQVVVYAYMQTDRTTVPKVLPPRYLINADFPALKVSELETVTPEKLGLTLIEGRHLGEVRLPEKYAKMPYDKFAELKKEFEKVYSATVKAYLNKTTASAAECKRAVELLPIFASEPLLPLLKKTNPAFFDELEKCSKQ